MAQCFELLLSGEKQGLQSNSKLKCTNLVQVRQSCV